MGDMSTNIGIHDVSDITITEVPSSMADGPEYVNRVTIKHGDSVTCLYTFSQRPVKIKHVARL